MIDLSSPRTRLRRRLRHSRDRMATLAISAGGIGVIAAVLAIGVYLAIEVLPLFARAEVSSTTVRIDATRSDDSQQGGAPSTVWLEATPHDTLLLLSRDGTLRTLSAEGRITAGQKILPRGTSINAVADAGAKGPLALGLEDGRVVLIPRDAHARPDWTQAHSWTLFDRHEVNQLALHIEETRWGLAGLDETGQTAWLEGRWPLTPHAPVRRQTLPDTGTHLALGQGFHLAIAEGRQLTLWSLASSAPQRLDNLSVLAETQHVTALAYLTGGETLIVGDSAGGVRRWLHANRTLLPTSPYARQGETAITALLPFPASQRFMALDAAGGLGLYQATAGQRWRGQAPAPTLAAAAYGDTGHSLYWLSEQGALQRLILDAEHVGVSWRTLWTPVHYAGFAQPEYRWQASTTQASDELKPSLVPLAWGTLKAAFWALIFAIPLALGAAIHTACFMTPRWRRRIKPTLELMEALPGVVIGFVAGLVLAPFVERHLAGVLSLVLVIPAGLWLVSRLWPRLPPGVQARLPEGAAGVWLIPWLALLIWGALELSPLLEAAFFAGDLQHWLERVAGLEYASRNAMIVGLAMGFAVIPTIYSLAEDALSGVPGSLAEGSQALGATRWQTLRRVQLPAASAGIFSAVMIGAGRAVGETMIVLMATGNTPLMSASLFEGLRSLAATIAIELPEAAVGGTHYRLLFLCALVLFLFTFLVNTLAEVVRLRLGRRYQLYGGGR
ncbi:ABC transporter permease subunit [Halomonas sp. WWR20]